MEKLLARVEAGEIKEEDLDESVARILKMKIEKGIMTGTLSETREEQLERAKAVVGCAAHHEREWEMAQLGLTLLKNEDGNYYSSGITTAELDLKAFIGNMIALLREEAIGDYTFMCKVTDGNGTVESNEATLTIVANP